MKRNKIFQALSLGIAAVAASAAVHAAPVTTVVIDANANGVVTGTLSTARSNFSAQLDSTQTENFSSSVLGEVTGPVPVFTGGALTPLTSEFQGYFMEATGGDGTGGGRFDTTCGGDPTCTQQWFEATQSFRIDFGGSFNGFGFYGTDIGDFNGSLLIELLVGDSVVVTLDRLAFSDQQLNRGALFWGVFDGSATYTGANILITQNNSREDGYDYFGFDDLLIGQVEDTGGTVPEPGSLALVGASLLALAAARRRRGRQA